MPKVKKITKTYTIEIRAIVEVIASFEIKATSKEDAESEAEDIFGNEIDFSISSMQGYQDYSLENLDLEVVEEE